MQRNRKKKSHGNKLIFFYPSFRFSFCIDWIFFVQYKSVAFAYRVAIQNKVLLYPLNDDDSLSQQLILFVIPLFYTPWCTLLDEWNGIEYEWLKDALWKRIINKFWLNWILSGGIFLFGSADFIFFIGDHCC